MDNRTSSEYAGSANSAAGRFEPKGVQLLNRAHEESYAPEIGYDRPHDWRDDARCKEMDPDLFFPAGTTGPALLQIEAAKEVCRQCTVREDCLEDGLREEYGIWGGITEEERRYIRRQRESERAATPVQSTAAMLERQRIRNNELQSQRRRQRREEDKAAKAGVE